MKYSDDYAARFWGHVAKSNGCWEWTAYRCRASGGYGIVSGGRRGRRMKAHRVAWELTHGPIPVGMRVCHRCDNPPCVRPDHLFLGTQRENVMDAIEKGRHISRMLGVVRPRGNDGRFVREQQS